MKQSIKEIDKELKIRLFYVLALTAIIANTLGFVSNVIIYGFTNITIFILVCAIIMYIVGGLGIYLKKIQLPANIILFLGNFIEFPVLFFAYGSYYILYMLLGIISTALFLEKKWRFIGSMIVILYDSIAICVKIMFPYYFIGVEVANLPAILVTYFISMMSIVIMIVILMKYYALQQTELLELTEELQKMANLDPLTHLYNRRYLVDYLQRQMHRDNGEFAIALLDIDDFKMINDQYGHVYGDKTLQVFADSMKKNMEGKGIASRFGGEEFMLVFDCLDKVVIEQSIHEIVKDLRIYGKETKDIEITFSAGVEFFYKKGEIVKLFNNADHKLYYAKHHGKNKIVFDETS